MSLMLPTFGPTITDNPPGVPLIGYRNQVVATNIFSDTFTDGHPVTNMANPATHLYWQGANAFSTGGFERIDINPLTGTIDYVALAGHNFHSANIGFYAEATGVSPPIPLTDPTNYRAVPDDQPLIARFASGSYSGLRIWLDLSAATDMPQVAVIYAGQLLALERGIKVDVTHVPITYGRKTRVVNGMSESGNFLGRVVLSESRESRADFFGFTPTFYRTSVDPFLISAQESPFFWAWAPTDYPLETGFAWLVNDAQPEVSPDHRRIALTLDMAGIA